MVKVDATVKDPIKIIPTFESDLPNWTQAWDNEDYKRAKYEIFRPKICPEKRYNLS